MTVQMTITDVRYPAARTLALSAAGAEDRASQLRRTVMKML